MCAIDNDEISICNDYFVFEYIVTGKFILGGEVVHSSYTIVS